MLTDANGNYTHCSVPRGLITSWSGRQLVGVFYPLKVTTGVQDSTAVGNIPATPEPSTNGISGASSLIGVSQTGGSSSAVSEIVTLSALEMVGINGSTSGYHSTYAAVRCHRECHHR
jgi:hypothetical protein